MANFKQNTLYINYFQVAVNGEHFCDFPHRIPFSNVSHLLIDGDVNVTLISWELSVPLVQGQPISEPSPLSFDSSQQLNSNQPFLPTAYQPQGSYNVPGGQYIPPAPPGVSTFLVRFKGAFHGCHVCESVFLELTRYSTK